MNAKTENPYVGPRTFQENERDRFFGREREARDLLALAVSEQMVLFYAQSGAGKSSLVNTCLIPDLRKKGFNIFAGRVIGDPPSGLRIENIYAFNLIRSLISGDVNLDWLAHMTLSDYFQGIAEEKNHVNESGEPQPHVLIIDQFEELFSTHQDAWEQREGFFQQIANAMASDHYLWVILVMREDFIAALDPYSPILPGRLRMRYYMQRLEHDAALDAIKKPVMELRPFEKGVAETLVDNLAQIKVKLPDGKLDERPGQYVEPVQLQVVCYSLWENLEQGNQITVEDLNKVGDVNQALKNFYDDRVQAVAKEKKIEERQIREWFNQEMITSSGTRNMVLRNLRGGQLDDRVIQALQGDLVRAETRGGQTWYELSHDRLIEPIQASNTKWFSANLSIFQQQAALWAAQGRPDGMLLRGKELEQAENEQTIAISESRTVPKEEVDFLTACIQARTRELREKRDIIRLRILAVGMAIFLIVVIGLAWTANALREQAVEAVSTATYALGEKGLALNDKEKALGDAEEANKRYDLEKGLREAEVLAGQAVIALANPDTLQLGRLLAVEAYQNASGEIIPSVYQALFDSVKGDNELINEKVFSLATFGPGEEIKWLAIDNEVWNLQTRQNTPLDLNSRRVIQSEFQSDNLLTLVTSDYSFFSDEPYLAFTVNLNNQSETPISLSYPQFEIDDVYLNSNGRQVIAFGWYEDKSGYSSALLKRDITQPTSRATLYKIGEDANVQSVTATNDGDMFVASTSTSIYLWRSDDVDLYSGTQILISDYTNFESTFEEGTFSGKSGNGLQISPDGAWLARLTNNGISIFDTNNFKNVKFNIPIKNADVYGFLFSPFSNSLIYVTSNYQTCTRGQSCRPEASALLYPLDETQTKQQVIYESTVADITALDISQNGKLVIGDESGYIRVWDLSLNLQKQVPLATSAHTGKIVGVLVGPDDQTIASTSSEDGTRLWKLTESATDAVITNRISNKLSIVVGNDVENTLAIGGINSENNIGNVHVYSDFQTPNQHQPRDDSYVSATGSSLSAVAVSQDWIAAARSDRRSNYREPSYHLDFWTRNPDASGNPFISFKLSSEVSSLAFFPDGKYLVVASSSGELWIDDTTDLDALRNNIPTSSEDTDAETDQFELELPNKAQLPNDLGKIQELFFTSNGRYLIGASVMGVRIWDTQKPLSGMYSMREATLPIRMSADQKWLVAAGISNSVQVLDLQTLSLVDFPLSDQTSIIHLAFNPDGSLLAVANKSGQISVFQFPLDTFPPAPLYTLRGAAGDITWIEFSPGPTDQQWLAASGRDKVYLWNLAKPNVKPIILQGYNGNVTYVDFTDNGEWIITVAEDQTIRFWSMDLEVLRTAACKYAERNFTVSEWERYFAGINYNEENVDTCKELNYELDVQTKIEASSNSIPTQKLPFIQPPTSTPEPSETFIQYIVQTGDTLDLIALKFNINRSVIMDDNNISNPNLISLGQVLRIRVPNTPTAP